MLMKRIKRLKTKLKNNINECYLKYRKKPIDEYLVLLEGGQGKNINGNMFSMLKEISTNEKYKQYTCCFVVTNDTIESARSRMAFYGFDKVRLVIRNSSEYQKCIATAKYLMTDNSFPPFFDKREEQVFLNTWHGTPLKTLGMSDKSNLASLANIQKNYLMSDYALFPNEFTKNVFFNDYDLNYTFTGKSLIANYPRNYIFYDAEQGLKMKSKLSLQDKQVFAYMPTWRGTGRKANIERQLEITKKILDEFDEKLNDNQVLLVNLHFLLSSSIDCDNYKHIKYFPLDYDTYEVLNACDGLITDYSSVFFDFAVTRKKIILFAYDKEEYLDTRGVYMPLESLGLPISYTVEETIEEMSLDSCVNDEFVEKYCPNGSVNSCELLFDMMINGETNAYQLEENKNANKNLCLIFAGKLPTVYFKPIKKYIESNPGYNYVIVYRKNFNKKSKEFVTGLDSKIETLGTVTAFNITKSVAINLFLNSRFDKHTQTLESFYENETHHLFYGLKPAKVVDFSTGNMVIAGCLSMLSGEKEYVIHGDFYAVSDKQSALITKIIGYEDSKGFVENDFSDSENKIYNEYSDEINAEGTFARCSKMINFMPKYIISSKKMRLISFFKLKTVIPVKMSDVSIVLGDNQKKPFYISLNNKSTKHFGIYSFSISKEEICKMPIKTFVYAGFENKYGKLIKAKVMYNSMKNCDTLGLRSPMFHTDDTKTTAVFRQMPKNRLGIYVRSTLVTDKLTERFKLFFAFLLSYLWKSSKSDNITLLYEKDSAKYEESASVTYEKLLDAGYNNAYFIIDKNYEYLDRVPEKYRKNLLYKHSFKHYLYFFKAKTFIGTEQPVHAIELKTLNVFALYKISRKNINFVFLQHGVMYMVSLNSESRAMFNRKALDGKYRVVVSSNLEKKHFTELGRHYPEDIYVCGLPKYDRNVLKPDADKIIIMPTWRPWEINMAREDFLSTPYFKMIVKIYESVPDELKDKVVILPHPLISNELKSLPDSISDKIVLSARYDDLLQEARLLITDYSSIAYDAFYRGTRVIFYWEEKDFCMSKYGPSTKLMLNEENVFGDFFYNTDGLSEAIRSNYDNSQQEKYKKNYSQIVEFHDGKNTERLIEFLKKDEII